jgi:Protein of unknown function (DUF1194)
MRWIAVFCASAVCWYLGTPVVARAADDVDVALVMVSDVSRSIDDSEYKLEKSGYASAFRNSKVIDAIRGGPNGRIAVAYVEFAGALEVHTVVDWTVLRDQASAQKFVDQLVAAPRSYWGRTAISAGVDRAVELFGEGGISATRHVIDVCGDGTNNAGRDITTARDDAVKAGVTINGLAIINDHPVSWTFAHVQPPGGLANYYKENVAGGQGNFVLEVHDFATFGEAITRKLIQEIAVGPGVGGRFVSR